MRGIVSIGRFRKKKEKEEREWMELDEKMEAFERAAAADAENHTAESIMAVLAAMNGLNRAMANNPFGRYVAREQQKREDDFKKRYKDVFAGAPDMPVARIKYFCGVLLKLWPAVEKGDWEKRCLACDDFFSVYSEGVDKAFAGWCRRDRKTEEMSGEAKAEYPFPQMMGIPKEDIGALLSETLGKIISIRPEEGFAVKKEFLWELIRLFDICRRVLRIFEDEVNERQETGNHGPDGCGIGDRMAD